MMRIFSLRQTAADLARRSAQAAFILACAVLLSLTLASCASGQTEPDASSNSEPAPVAARDAGTGGQSDAASKQENEQASQEEGAASPTAAQTADEENGARAMFASEARAYTADGMQADDSAQTSIRVANDCGIEGLAADAKERLNAQGFTNVTANNAADGGESDQSSVLYRHAEDAQAAAKIAAILEIDETHQSGFVDDAGEAVPIVNVYGPYGPRDDFGADILVVIGHDYYGGVYDPSTGYWYRAQDAAERGLTSRPDQ